MASARFRSTQPGALHPNHIAYRGYVGRVREVAGADHLGAFVNVPIPQRPVSTPTTQPGFEGGATGGDFLSNTLRQLYERQAKLVDFTPQELPAERGVTTELGRKAVPVFVSPAEDEGRPAPGTPGPTWQHFIKAMLAILSAEDFDGDLVTGAYLSLLRATMREGWAQLRAVCRRCEIDIDDIPLARLDRCIVLREEWERAEPLLMDLDAYIQENPDATLDTLPENLQGVRDLVPPEEGPVASLLEAYQSTGDDQFELTEPVVMSIIGTLLLIIPKKLMQANHRGWMTRRMEVFESQLALTGDQKAWLLEHMISQPVCAYITSRIGNRMPFRVRAYTIAESWSKSDTHGLRLKLAEILLSLFANVDTTHLQLIETYIINEVPALMASGPLRAEAPAVFRAIVRMLSLGKQAPYARMLYSHSAIPEIQRSNMRLAAAFAQELAVRDFPSFKNYAKVDNQTFQSLCAELHGLYNRSREVIPDKYLRLLQQEYGSQQRPLAMSALQPSLVSTVIATDLFNENESNDD